MRARFPFCPAPGVVNAGFANESGNTAGAPKAAQIGRDEPERVTQNLMMAYAVENAGDAGTEQLVIKIQKQEQETANKVWAQLVPTAQKAIGAVALAKAS